MEHSQCAIYMFVCVSMCGQRVWLWQEGHIAAAEHAQSQAQQPLNQKQWELSHIYRTDNYTALYYHQVTAKCGKTFQHNILPKPGQNVSAPGLYNPWMRGFWHQRYREKSISGPNMVPRTSRRAQLCWSVHINFFSLLQMENATVCSAASLRTIALITVS